jgi:eukaryotic-like serine/threonine-protein kinase
MPIQSGTHLGPYEILSAIGAGGMGEVYEARDTKLGRSIAIKVLPPTFVDNAERVARFQREARMLASLNHPNIATIHGFEESGGRHYLVMELVPGQTLAERLSTGALDTPEALAIARQIALALETAHEQGVIHRDLKPANIKVTPDGRVKILDFGLAKALADDRSGDLSQAATLSVADTVEGTILGTPSYMSPEQLRGKTVDKRTDIWAFGCVVYEMLTGRRAFRGETLPDTIAAVLEREPDWKALSVSTPARVQGLVRRCLQKDSQRRLRDLGDARIELEETSATLESVDAPLAPPAAVLERWRHWALLGVSVLAVLLLALATVEWFRSQRSGPPVAPREDWVQITDFADSAVSPALSPDGRILTFIRGDDTFLGVGQIYAKLLPNGEPVELTHDSIGKMSPQFSTDSSTIAYTVAGWNTWSIPALGGDARLMLPNAEGLTWIDPKHLLFSEIKTGIHMAVVTATDTRDQSRDVYVPPRERGMAHRSALSPDRKWVLVAEMDNGGWLPCRLVPFDGNSSGSPVGPLGAGCTYVAWSPDQVWMYFSSDKGGRFHIWRQRFPHGELQQVTSGPTEEEGITIAPDGRSLITSLGLRESTIWVRDLTGEHQVSSESYAEFPQFSPDGKKLYYLIRRHGVSGEFVSGELWVADLQTGRSERLLPHTLVSGYDVSPDGTQVVFSAKDEDNHSHVWLASLDFRFPPRQFSSAVSEDQPHWDRTAHIYFRAAEGKSNFLYRMKSDGSERSKLLADPILEFHGISRDGRWAVLTQTLGQGVGAHVFATRLDGEARVTLCARYCVAGWSPDGRTFMVALDTMEGAKSLVVPLDSANSVPPLPPGGLETHRDMENVKGGKVLDGPVAIGPAGLSATVHEDVHRNLYRVPLQ